jgi:hypothetical protein
MNDFDPAEFREAFLVANANEDFIVGQLASVIRDLMRAVSSDDSSGGVYSAAKAMKFIGDLLARCQEQPSWYRLLSAAVEDIKANIPDDPDDRKFIDAATRGIKYFVEASATDNAAKGRASRRHQEFRDAIRRSLESRGGRL